MAAGNGKSLWCFVEALKGATHCKSGGYAACFGEVQFHLAVLMLLYKLEEYTTLDIDW